MRWYKTVLAIIALLLFVGNYGICTLFYPSFGDGWWWLRGIIYSAIFTSIGFVAFSKRNNKVLNFVLINFIVLSCGDFICRIAGITDFIIVDYLLIAMSLVISCKITFKL
jgi:hypothetical protein